MQHRIFFLAAVLTSLGASVSHAQVSTDPRALDQLKPPAADNAPPSGPDHATTRPDRRSEPSARSGRSAAPTRPPERARTEMYGPPRPPAVAAVLPTVPPKGPVIPPAIVVPTRPTPPPPPVPIVAGAPGVAMPMPDGLRVTFGAGRADLNGATSGALRSLVHGAPPFDTTVFTVTSTAAPQADDPSTPRRLALSRALAVRAVLISEGVASPRIIVKVVGGSESTPGTPPDRVDVAVKVQGQTEGAAGATPAAAPAKTP